MLTFIVWCLSGVFAGWYFGVRTRRDAAHEVQRNIAVGIVGGVLGGFLFHWSVTRDLLGVGSMFTAFVGAIALLALGNWFLRPGVE
jgi:uncharacterized membrane protein YeaQ/YmgE (transglycosylase-associated protein family)